MGLFARPSIGVVVQSLLADYFVIFATKDRRLNYRGVTAFVVPRDTPGLSVGPPQLSLGFGYVAMLSAPKSGRSAWLTRATAPFAATE